MWKRKRFKKKPSVILNKILPIIFMLLIVVLLFFFIKMGLFNIKKVETETIQLGCVSENQLKDSSGILGQNFFFVNSEKIEENLKKKFFCVKSVTLLKQLPDRVTMRVSGRQPFAILSSLKDKLASSSSQLETIATPAASQVENSYMVDGEGIVFDRDKDGLNIPKIYIYDPSISLGKNLADDLIFNCLKILDKVKVFGIDAKEGWVIDGFFVINSNPKPKIIFRLDGKIDIQLASLQLILTEAKINSRDLEFIDLRFDKPIVRFAPKKNG